MPNLSPSPSKKDFCVYFDVSYFTFNKWIAPHKKKIGKYTGKRFTPKQKKIILECLGEK